MLEFLNTDFSYGEKKIFEDFSFYVKEGTSTAILGPSGFGKTTLLELAAGFLKPQSGKIVPFDEKPTFIFQEDRLLPWATAFENLLAVNIEKEKALEYLEKVGLSDSAEKYPEELSGGMCRRLSIARALAKNPKLLLCDEPTGALDYNTGKQILQLLQDTCRKENITVVLITHNSALAPMADRLIRFKSGKVMEITCNEKPTPIADIEW